jgi:hypothetical protein
MTTIAIYTDQRASTMEIKSDDYLVTYNPEATTVAFEGLLRLSGMDEYAPIVGLLNEIAAKNPSRLTLDLRSLQFLNSSGINMLSKFVLRVRQQDKIQVIVRGSNEIPWQSKSLKNFQRLMPTLELEFD